MKKIKFGALGVLVGMLLIVYLYFIGSEETKDMSPKTSELEEEVSEDLKPVEKVDETGVVYEGQEKSELIEAEDPNFDGTKEAAEVKEDDYAYLLEAEPVIFTPLIPVYMQERKIQPERINGYFDMGVEERYKEMVQFDFGPDERAEIEKLKIINKTIESSFKQANYNDFLKVMYKNYREDYGVRMANLVKNGRFEEEDVEFFPEVVDTKLGFAYGVYFKKLVYIEDGKKGKETWSDGVIIYKQNDNDEWEIYYEIPF